MADGEIAALAARAIAIAEEAGATQTRIVAQQARSRRTTRLLAVSVVLDVMLSLFALYLARAQYDVTHAIRGSQLASCTIGNHFRAGQVQLWDHVIAVSTAPPHESSAARAARLAKLAAFHAYVGHQFAPVNCTQLYRR